MKGEGLLVTLQIHRKLQGAERLSNKQGSNCFFTNIIYSVVTFCLLNMTFLSIFILLLFWPEKKR